MSYELTKSDGSTLVQLEDGLIDSASASIKFVGKNVVNYGEIQNENFLHLLENFSHNTAPNLPLQGQLWFDSSLSSLKLKVFDGTVWNQVPTMVYNTTATNVAPGDLWFKTSTNELYIRTGTNFLLVGPNGAAQTAQQLANSVSINGTPFTGTASITITAASSFSLTAGNYLSAPSTYDGSANVTFAVDVGTVSQATPNKVVARNNVGDIWFNEGHGVASSSKYADLAEKYLAENSYEPGTVVAVGGPLEVTACKPGDVAIGVVSKHPGFKMNTELANGTYIALKGRVPVKITGNVTKGSRLVAGPTGTAQVGKKDYFAIALEDSNGNNIIEAIIL